jgi:hypothetical protein
MMRGEIFVVFCEVIFKRFPFFCNKKSLPKSIKRRNGISADKKP